MNKAHYLIISVSISIISGCSSLNQIDNSEPYHDDSHYYQQVYPVTVDYRESDEVPNRVQNSNIPIADSYHIGAHRAPIAAKDQDKNWIDGQDPQGYTIEVADNEKAALVAKALYELPKNNRQAEVKYQRYGRVYYKGLYGSYANKSDALQALDALPAHLKSQAGIKSWQHVQHLTHD